MTGRLLSIVILTSIAPYVTSIAPYVVSGFPPAPLAPARPSRSAGRAEAGSVPSRSSRTQQPTRTTKDAVFTGAQARRGEALYQQQCAVCHGSTLGGAEAAPALAGAVFAASWTEAPLSDLFERIRVSMPQDKPGTLSRPQTADLIAYILEVNGAPAGQVELPADVEALKMIKIVATN